MPHNSRGQRVYTNAQTKELRKPQKTKKKKTSASNQGGASIGSGASASG